MLRSGAVRGLTVREPTSSPVPRRRRAGGSARSRSASRGRARAGTPAARSRARDARGRSGGSRRRRGSRTPGSPAGRACSAASATTAGSSASRFTSSRSSGASEPDGLRRHRRVAGVAQDPRDARVRVLHVVDGVLLRTSPRRGRCRSSIVWSGPRLTRYQRAASTPISSMKSSRKTTSPRRFDIFVCSPPFVRWTSW